MTNISTLQPESCIAHLLARQRPCAPALQCDTGAVTNAQPLLRQTPICERFLQCLVLAQLCSGGTANITLHTVNGLAHLCPTPLTIISIRHLESCHALLATEPPACVSALAVTNTQSTLNHTAPVITPQPCPAQACPQACPRLWLRIPQSKTVNGPASPA